MVTLLGISLEEALENVSNFLTPGGRVWPFLGPVLRGREHHSPAQSSGGP